MHTYTNPNFNKNKSKQKKQKKSKPPKREEAFYMSFQDLNLGTTYFKCS